MFCWEMQSHSTAGLALCHLTAPLKNIPPIQGTQCPVSQAGRQCFYGNSSQRFALLAAAAYCMTSFAYCSSLQGL